MNRRQFLLGAGSALALGAPLLAAAKDAASATTLKDAAQARGFDVGVMVDRVQMDRADFMGMVKSNFSLIANQLGIMDYDFYPGEDAPPDPYPLAHFIDVCKTYGLKPRVHTVYTHEGTPDSIAFRRDGTPKSSAEMEKTLLARVDEICRPLRGMNATIQVLDEILNDHEGGIRQDPFTKVFGEELADMLFHAAHEAAPDALLTYQETGIDVDPHHFFKRKTADYLALLERLRKRNVPITGVGLGGFAEPPHGDDLDQSVFRRVEDMGYDVHLNELTVIYKICDYPVEWKPKTQAENDATVAATYEKAFHFYCQLKRLREITFWAPVDHDNTLDAGFLCILGSPVARPGIFNQDLTPKPVYQRLVKAIQQTRPTN